MNLSSPSADRARARATAATRIERVREAMERERGDWLLIPASADFRWITGAPARSTERLVAFALPSRGEPFAVVPRLEAAALSHECPWLELEVWDETDDPFERLDRRMGLSRGPRVLIGEGMRVAPLLRLAARVRCHPAAAALGDLRAVKDADELRNLALAAAHADRIVEEAADFMRAGTTEREVATFVMSRFDAAGDREAWAIVASGANAALPHHFTSERRLEDGDVVILDVGAFTEGYGSDITRTYFLDEPGPEARNVYGIVNQAREAGIAASRPGAACESVDRAARERIERAGFGEFFTHRTGHGVGLEVHEPPYLVSGNPARLREGMVHSVEPGIYLPGRFGIRLEDLVAVENAGARRLNRAPLDPRPPRSRP
ncbi:MAG: aminopeptidase P family protein [Candidatus Eisenbacteria bacterium]|nr:aminopeptidase P family protein [Candidatus Eisenbacteria bacterium]